MLHQQFESSFIRSHRLETASTGAIALASSGRYHHRVATAVPTVMEDSAPLGHLIGGYQAPGQSENDGSIIDRSLDTDQSSALQPET